MKNVSKLSLVLPCLLLVSCFSPKTYTDTSKYPEYLKSAIENSDFHSKLYIFPQDISQEEIKTVTYQARDDLFAGSYFFYLVAQYNQERFLEEISRLDSVKAVFKDGTIKPILKYEEQELYLTIDKDNRCEYVKYNEETYEIAYVSNQLFEWYKVDISNEYLQDDVTIPQELDDGDNTYNMYYSYKDDVGYYVDD